MLKWRPNPTIRVKALGLHWRDGCLLAAEVCDDSGKIRGVRPLGGTMEFGEVWQETLRREFMEELAIDVSIAGDAFVFENIYTFEGVNGHEIFFIAEVIFPKNAFMGQDEIIFYEDDGTRSKARWFDMDDLDNGNLPLYPAGLKERLHLNDPAE